jgi:hypothetical protein
MGKPEERNSPSGQAAPLQRPPARGFWCTTAANARDLLNWDLLCAAILTGVGAWRITSATLGKVLPTLLVAEFGIVGALLGLVIAGLAIIVGFLGADFSLLLWRAPGGGPMRDFWPFWYVAALSAAAIIASGAGLLAVEQDASLRHVVFGVTTFVATYAVLAAVNLVGSAATQGETRAYQLARKAEQDERP